MKDHSRSEPIEEPLESPEVESAAPEDDQAAPAAPGEAEAVAAADATVEVESALAELNDRYLRLAAEFDNFKKRTAREWHERARQANADVLADLLEIVDNFERALAVEHADSPYATGVRMIYEQLQAFLARQGVEVIPALGEAFDPNVHDALLHLASDEYPEGRVCQEIRRGYLLHGRVLRAAQVAVSRGAAADDSGTDEHSATHEE